MRVIRHVAVLCLAIVSITCRSDHCPNGISALQENPRPLTVYELNTLKNGMKAAKVFNSDVDGHINEIRKFIVTKNLSSEQPIYYSLFTNKNPRKAYNLTFDKWNLKNSPYDDTKPTAFLIHGYVPTGNYYVDGIMSLIREGLINVGDYNVIFPDFRSAISSTSVFSTLKNLYLVAKHISSFIYFLQANSATHLKDLQLIGLSLGGQLVGHIGEFTPGLGRITALDPTERIFSKLPDDLRLSPDDANFVDVIHTNGGKLPAGFGMHRQSGTVDFYINGGKIQPNCNSREPTKKKPGLDEPEFLARLCMHERAVDYFVTSMCKGCQYIGVACESHKDFKMGICNKYNSRTAIMGQFATKPKHPLPKNLKFFVDTDDKWPYCRNTTEPRHFM